MKKTNAFLIGLCFLFVASHVAAEVKLPAVIGNNMVLQQKTKAPIWGWAEPGEKVKVKGSWQWFDASTKAGKDGKWMVKISTPKAGGPYTVNIKGENIITLENVLVGEVWICSGQSNMEWPLRAANDAQAEIAQADYPEIRLFMVKNTISRKPLDDCQGSWSPCSPDSATGFSAVGYFFGRKLHKDLSVPVGLIASDWGGTPAESWTRAEALMEMPEFVEQVKKVSDTEASADIEKAFKDKLANWWKNLAEKDPGFKANWYKRQLDDSAWPKMELPTAWESTEVGNFDGTVWFRRVFNLPPSWAKADLTVKLGTIDDMDIVWVNGKKIGATEKYGNWNKPRVYNIPASVTNVGPNVITVYVVDTGGGGGLFGKPEQMIVKPAGAKDKTAATLKGKWGYKIGIDVKDIPPQPKSSPDFNSHTPTSLYNGMIAPLIPYAIQGAVWYQGESNAGRAYQYRTLFPIMIKNWRNDWARGDFPFYFVQIAPYRNQNPEIREAQLLTYRKVPNTGIVVTTDIGNPNNIHPKNKQDVGKRLALWALAKTYGNKDIVYSGPLYKSMKVEGDKIRLFFDYADGGLIARDGTLTHFIIAGEDKKFVEVKAVIDGDTIVVQSDKVKNPVAVRFGWENTAEPNLFNKAQLPASPFRTDDWPGDTINNK